MDSLVRQRERSSYKCVFFRLCFMSLREHTGHGFKTVMVHQPEGYKRDLSCFACTTNML